MNPKTDRLPFLDGIRGLAALTVVAGHIARSGGYLLDDHQSFFQASWTERALWFAWPATAMIYLFLMVSGFSLAYSEDRRRISKPPTSLKTFFKRRAWRILPTYYCAFAFGLLVWALIPTHLIVNTAFQRADVTQGGFLSHLVLLHNAKPQWMNQGNGPLWTMAMEFQLYLVFPLLYWLSKKISPIIVGGGAIAIDLYLHTYLHAAHPNLWPLQLLRWFALGIMLAGIYRSAFIQRLSPELLAGVGGFIALLADSNIGPLQYTHEYAHDAAFAAGFSLLLLGMCQVPMSSLNPCNWRLVRELGARSYSLYAFHFPAIAACFAAITAMGVTTDGVRTLLMFGVGVPVSLLVAEVMYRLVEVPALRRVRKAGSRLQTEQPHPHESAIALTVN